MKENEGKVKKSFRKGFSEEKLLKIINKKEKAKKRTRGPYRKSAKVKARK